MQEAEITKTGAPTVNADMKTYCVYCKTGCEKNVIWRLERMGYRSFTPLAIRVTYEGKAKIRAERLLLPGYVFFECANATKETWKRIVQISDILKILQYVNESYALTGRDLALVNWFRRHGAYIGISKVYKKDGRIRVVEGPLKGFEDWIVKYNPKRGCVALAIETEIMPFLVWCSVELTDEPSALAQAVTAG